MASLAEQLDQARAALHALRIGRGVATIRDANGEEVIYSRADVGRLAAYVLDLERQLAGRKPVLAVRFQTSKGL